MTDDNKKQWYFNTVKKQAELGMVSPIEQRMGPYKTKEDAEHAWGHRGGPQCQMGGGEPALEELRRETRTGSPRGLTVEN